MQLGGILNGFQDNMENFIAVMKIWIFPGILSILSNTALIITIKLKLLWQKFDLLQKFREKGLPKYGQAKK